MKICKELERLLFILLFQIVLVFSISGQEIIVSATKSKECNSALINCSNLNILLEHRSDKDMGLKYLTIKVNGVLVPNPGSEECEGRSEEERAQFEYAEYSFEKKAETIAGRQYLLLSVRGAPYSGSYSEEEWTHIIDVQNGKVAAQVLTFSGDHGSAMETMYFNARIVPANSRFEVFRCWTPYGPGYYSWMGPFAFGKSLLVPGKEGVLKEKKVSQYCIVPELRDGAPYHDKSYKYSADKNFFSDLGKILDVFSDQPGVTEYFKEFAGQEIPKEAHKETRMPLVEIQKLIATKLKNGETK